MDDAKTLSLGLPGKAHTSVLYVTLLSKLFFLLTRVLKIDV